MRANQNSQQELDLYSKTNPITLSSNSAELGQDHLAIGKLSTIRTRLGTIVETRNGANKISCSVITVLTGEWEAAIILS
jgi:hypothetical protein